ncbi:sigma 54-interacting transcriptional regulator [Chryseobacterium sp. RG1]|uniref:Sigma 54-interacting transcriptional regulator n=1 Tax=Chryseobacterium tagetis TaxID=2801334 RepID=A0ABS8A2L3_9FLAO|nr:sigma 54-interacting transcriptional regulator [Chryseobacterium tagetis]MCA6068231.1 sigma 54-interacting transcriptional regulator [Chryseobacterium tagetis]
MDTRPDQNSIITQRLQEMQKEWSVLSALNRSFSKALDKKSFGQALQQSFKEEFGFNECLVLQIDEQHKESEIFYSTFQVQSAQNQSLISYFQQCINSPEVVLSDLKDFKETKTFFFEAKNKEMRSVIGFCLPSVDETINIIFLFYKNFVSLGGINERILTQISTQLSITIRNISLTEKFKNLEIQNGNSQIEIETEVSQKSEHGFQGIIGESKIMKDIFEKISQVAPSESNVLIHGETGTGKELIAQAIHQLSNFSNKKMVRINCAAIPANLIESELFGHEKGSFTGATEQRKGKFEEAHNSTIFLDEIGELPLELQGRLLRVLQEKEIERIGGNKRIKVNARVITATNRNLEKEVLEGNFRSDLFYRLNVFPIELPALRKRKEDIPLLAEYFLKKLHIKTGKKITGFSQKVMNQMIENPWLGNIRELENIIERSILTAKDNIIKEINLPKAITVQNDHQDFQIKPLQEIEREYILKAVSRCNGRISGKNGAAVLLGLPSTTLISKMQKLGIKKGHYFRGNE